MPKHIHHYILLAALFSFFLAGGPVWAQSKNKKINTAASFSLIKQKILKTDRELPSNRFPIVTDLSGKWKHTAPSGWSSGFYPGLLWLTYEKTGDRQLRLTAERRQQFLESQKFNNKTHDTGFMIFQSFGNGYRLTGNPLYKKTVIQAARTLITRYNPRVGLIKSWDSRPNEHKTIIDNLMNLEMLFWAAKQSGEPSWKTLAAAHAKKTIRDFVRDDGSVFHVVNYDARTGKLTGKTTAQGYSASSAWSRGQAWAIYGFTIAYRETGDTEFLKAARKTADYFLKNLPADNVPFWDFRIPSDKNEPKDSSAAAIAASGLLELSRYENDASRKQRYFTAAEKILSSLSSNRYAANPASEERSVLRFGAYNRKAGEFGSGTIWGDYYFAEALLKYDRQEYRPRP